MPGWRTRGSPQRKLIDVVEEDSWRDGVSEEDATTTNMFIFFVFLSV